MFADVLAFLPNLSSDYVFVADPNTVFFLEETDDAGKGKTFFQSESNVIVLKAHHNPPLVWALKNRKCSEGAIITFNDDGCHLHILEMKSRLDPIEWKKAILQYEGMLLASIAIGKLLSIDRFSSVTCYIALKRDLLTEGVSADPVLLKTFVGKDNPLAGLREWFLEEIPLPFGIVGRLRKAVRDADNNADFGQI